ncbi:DUF2793 domain-containing protein [Mesorhizobium sp. ANAO-SY3R2]|uniref:DUF2793 domain-containing protein n=1 Tax=Mesorhizobium sp. ANAO-SY3R2 TaxID=3166644 RepID=UPI00366EAE57
MEQTTNLKMPFIMPSQAQKHVTHNEALLALDVLVQLSVLDRHLAAPPPLPAEGSRYIVAAPATGAWAGKSGQVAAWQDGAWSFHPPVSGWLAWVADEQRILAYDGSGWIDTLSLGVNPASVVGINTTADTTNRLAVKSPAVLFDNQGAGQQVKINKAALGDTASVLFQTGYSGRAEFGLTGDDDWHVKVSPDGSAWTEALKVSCTDGRVLLPAAVALTDQNQVVAKRHVRELLTANRTYYVRTDGSDANNGLSNTSGGAFLTIAKALAVTAALDGATYNVTVQVGPGTWTVPIVLPQFIGSGTWTLQGDPATPSNVTLNVTGICLTASAINSTWRVSGFKLQATQHGIYVDANSTLRYASIEFGGCTTSHINVANRGSAIAYGNTTISGGALIHWYLSGGSFVIDAGKTITIVGTPAFANFVQCDGASVAMVNQNTFVGSATGKRYSAITNSVINVNGAGAAYLPGDVAGTTATGGQYV